VTQTCQPVGIAQKIHIESTPNPRMTQTAKCKERVTWEQREAGGCASKTNGSTGKAVCWDVMPRPSLVHSNQKNGLGNEGSKRGKHRISLRPGLGRQGRGGSLHLFRPRRENALGPAGPSAVTMEAAKLRTPRKGRTQGRDRKNISRNKCLHLNSAENWVSNTKRPESPAFRSTYI